MTRSSRRAFLGAAGGLLAPVAWAQQAGPITIVQPWTRAAGANATGAGFMTIRNAGAADRLVAARSPAARTVELHTHIRDGDVMRMRPVAAIDVPSGQPVTLAPGGVHLMLIGLVSPTRPGDRVPVTLTFESAGEVMVHLVVESAGARRPGGDGSHRH
jgi:periplasmic copper chaperone A